MTFLRILVCALATVVAAAIAPIAGADDEAAPAAPRFSEQVDLDALGRLAVHSEGRLKSLGSHANSMLAYVSGPKRIDGQTSLFTYIDMMLRPDAYDDADIIYVKNKPVRAQIAEAFVRADPSLEDRADTFVQTGLTSPKLLRTAEVQKLLRKLESDVIRTERSVREIRSALAVSDPRFLLSSLRVVPPADGNAQSPWHGIDEVMFAGPDGSLPADVKPETAGRVTAAWRQLVNAWSAQDPAGVAAASAELETFLPTVAPQLYPEQSRLAWESWYFAKDQLTFVWLAYLVTVVLLLLGIVYRWPLARRLGIAAFVLSFALQTFALGLRWYISNRWPNSNMFEAVTTAAWFGGCAAFVIEHFVRRSAMHSLFFLGSAVASMVALMTAHFLPAYLNPNIGNMTPVLHDVWLYIHTNVVIFSYCLIFMAAVSGVCYLVWRAFGGAPAFARVGGGGSLVLAQGGAVGRGASSVSWGEVFDGVTMVLMELAFVMLWAGIAMGAIWADHSWGRPWGWDPKEVFALNTFVVFAVLIHVRLKAKDKGLWTAILSVVGAGVMLFNWIVINFVISGLHSYA